ncbi:hypothetical protein PMAYCL1PPCAC_01216 [Pristionchus mayeri]|uniref:Secreted protein n=1 Tax=Pristionchus mayeri TaxID=1317129 RepID=A0AAN4YZB9_9BILA|nr:hypothetical protein PMAYCL1PPCAC_01216 [Pristionchus mayeri]
MRYSSLLHAVLLLLVSVVMTVRACVLCSSIGARRVPHHSLEVGTALLRQLHVVQIVRRVPSGSQSARSLELDYAILSLLLILILLHVFLLGIELLALCHLLVDRIHCAHIAGNESEDQISILALLLFSLSSITSLQLLMGHLDLCCSRGLLLRVQGDGTAATAAACSASIGHDQHVLVREGGDVGAHSVHDDLRIRKGEAATLTTGNPRHRTLCDGECTLSGDRRVVQVGDHLILDEPHSVLRDSNFA